MEKELTEKDVEITNQKHEIENLKSIYTKLRDDTAKSLNSFCQYKTKMERNAALHEKNILAYIGIIKRKNKEIEALKQGLNQCT